MYITHESQEQLKKDILRILNKHLDLREYRVFFFGSRVKKKCNDRSDIDLGIEGQNPVSAEAWQNIKEDIDNLRTLYTIDCVDFNFLCVE